MRATASYSYEGLEAMAIATSYFDIVVPNWIQTWDRSVCLYLNLKYGNLDHSATMDGMRFDPLMVITFIKYYGTS